MKHCIDIYKKWIIAFVDGQWRKVHIEPGWVTFARWDEPNQHIGICKEDDVTKRGISHVADLATSRHALVAGPVLEEDVLERIGCVRFGRVQTLRPEFTSLECVPPHVCADLDDTCTGQDWPRVDLPATPRHWPRTARSLANS